MNLEIQNEFRIHLSLKCQLTVKEITVRKSVRLRNILVVLSYRTIYFMTDAGLKFPIRRGYAH